MRYIFTYCFIVLAVIVASGCRKDKDPKPQETGKGNVTLEFTNKVGSDNLILSQADIDSYQWYLNENGDSFTVSKFDYYISNIKLNGKDGNVYSEPESYHLLLQSDLSTLNFKLNDIPAGDYSSITLTIGVDSARNVTGAQTGALDLEHGMFWNWNFGYIMLKLEGNSPRATQSGNILMFHAGGYSGPDNVVRTITLSFPEALSLGATASHVHLQADVQALFKSPNKIDFATKSVIHEPGEDARKFADNYATMFTITGAGSH